MACVCHCTTWSKQQLHSFTVVEVLKAHPSSRSSSQKRYGLHKTDNKPLVVVAQAQPQRNEAYRSSGWDRRGMLLGSILVAACPLGSVAATVDDAVPVDIDVLASYAFQAYNEKDLQRARDYFSRIISRDSNPVWLERRGQVLVDMKEFNEALDDFNRAELLYRESDATYVSLGLLTNRGLAYEGLYKWNEALKDYDEAVFQSSEVGYSIPYILNSRGNCHSSLAVLAQKRQRGGTEAAAEADKEWKAARDDYKSSAEVFQRSRNLSGAIFASSNAALISAQLGNDSVALQELTAVARRAPGSIDMRAALAAIYWSAGDEQKAEKTWNWACSKINSGQLVPGGPVLDSCGRYADADWLSRIRRWPPVMVQRMNDFLALQESSAPATLSTA